MPSRPSLQAWRNTASPSLYSSNCEGGRPSSEQLLPIERIAMTRTHFAEGQVLFREGDSADSVFRLLSGSVDILRELDGDPILLGTVGAGQFIGEMGVVENRPPQCDGSSRQRDRD